MAIQMLHAAAIVAGKTVELPVLCSGAEKMQFTIPKAAVPAGMKSLTVYFDGLDAAAGQEGYYLVPWTNACFLTRFTPRKDDAFFCRSCIIPLLGAKIGEDAYLITVDSMQYTYALHIRVQGGKYTYSLTYDGNETDIYEDISFTVYRLTGEQADYNGMASLYRKLRNARRPLTPLTEKIKTSPANAYAEDMLEIRIRMGWKPVPSPVLEQTPETEPPMHVACTFAQVEELMDEMQVQGIKKAELCLVGWNQKGHDGRWPQIFPVEEALGGEEGLRKLLAHAKKLGYRVTCHTNNSDAYRIADCWNEEFIIKNRDGSLSDNHGVTWGGGKMYYVCPQCAYEWHASRDLPVIASYGFSGFHYIDCLSICPVHTCFDENHPLTARESVDWMEKIMGCAKENIGGIASEGGFDWAMNTLDYALYVGFNIMAGTPALADETVPFWQLVFHGYIWSNPTSETVNYMVKPVEYRLKFHEFGGYPIVYFFSRFHGESNWMGDLDYTFTNREEMRQCVTNMKKTLEDYAPMKAHQLAFMERHDKLQEGVTCTTYSDGCRVVVNFTEKDVVWQGHTVKAKDLLIWEP